MRVVIDFFKLIKGDGKSIGIYNVGFNVITNISRLCRDNNVELYVLCNSINKKDFEGVDVRLIEITNLNPRNKIHCVYWELFGVNKKLEEISADVVLFPRGFISINCPVKCIALIHDMIPFYYNEFHKGYFNRLENFYIMNRLKYSAEHADEIITVSEFSKNEIVKYSRIDESRIKVIYNGVEEIDTSTIPKENGNYICAMTSRLPHKNATGIIRSYAKYCKISDNPLKLVLIGIDKTDINDYSNIPDNVLGNIEFRKYIKSNTELYQVIRDARLFLFLSLIEGFGLPPIEAMQLGAPVICSNCSSLPEVVADAALKVNPKDYDCIANEINRCVNNDDLCNELTKKGNKNSKRFKWDVQGGIYFDTIMRIFNNNII